MVNPSTFSSAAIIFALVGRWRPAYSFSDIAGYTPESDVEPHSKLDLDTQLMEIYSDDGNFTMAYKLYSEGENSVKDDGEIRTLQGFSTGAQAKLTGEVWYDIYTEYWNGDYEYANTFTEGACLGDGFYIDASTSSKAEGCVKGAQYQNVWMYVIHEMEDAINDCYIGDEDANTDGVHAWDEAWAFYAGSLEGTDGTGEGMHIYALAEKRCENFGTCTGDNDGLDYSGTSAVNSRLLELFEEGRDTFSGGEFDCETLTSIKEDIVDLMTVPLIQGIVRYLYEADPNASDGGDKEASELWAFAAAALPRIHECDVSVAALIRENSEITLSTAPMSDGYKVVKEQLETVYNCLGITCTDVGGYLDSDNENFVEGMEPCADSSNDDDDDDDELPEWAVAIVVIVVIGVVGGTLFFCFRRRKKAGGSTSADGLGGFGAKASSTL